MSKRTKNPKLTEAQVKKAVSALRDSRRAHLTLRPSQIVAPQRAFHKFVPSLIKAGIDLDEFKKISAEHLAELRRLRNKQKADWIKQAASDRNILRRELVNRRKASEYLQALPGQTYFVLERPLFIWPKPVSVLQAEHIEPFNSSAKIQFGSSAPSGVATLSFYFLWQNPSNDNIALIDADAIIMLNGSCSVGRDGGTLPDNRQSNLHLNLQLFPMPLWQNPPAIVTSDVRNALDLSVVGGGFMDLGEIKPARVFRGYDLSGSVFIIPPRESIVVEVTLGINYDNSHGHVEVDFASGDFQVLCPLVMINLRGSILVLDWKALSQG